MKAQILSGDGPIRLILEIGIHEKIQYLDDTLRRFWFMKSKLLFSCALLFIALMGVLSSSFACYAREIDHPFFQSEEYKRYTQDQNTQRSEIERLQDERQKLILKRNSYDKPQFFVYSLFAVFSSYLGIWGLIMSLALSIGLAFLYLYYLKHYNQAKWFVLFKTKGNLSLFLKRSKQLNKVVILLCLGLSFLPGQVFAETTLVQEIGYYLFGNEIEKSYVLIKYAKKTEVLPYDNIQDVELYRKFEAGSFEQNYNFIVHQHFMGLKSESEDIVQLIKRSRNETDLISVYKFIYRIEQGKLKAILDARLQELSRTKTPLDVRLIEIRAIVAGIQHTDKYPPFKDDILSLMKRWIVESTDLGQDMILCEAMLDIDWDQGLEMWNKIRYRFDDVLRVESYKDGYVSLAYRIKAKSPQELYKASEFASRIEEYSDDFKFAVCRLLDPVHHESAKIALSTVRLEKLVSLPVPDMIALAELARRYRPNDTIILFDTLIDKFVESSTGSIDSLAPVMDKLGYSRDQVGTAMILKDIEIHGAKGEKSFLINPPFLNYIGDQTFVKHFEFFQQRPQHGRIIVEALFERNNDLFLRYLDFFYNEHKDILKDVTFPNKLFSFAKWTDFVSDQAIQSAATIPYQFYLADKEVLSPQPRINRVKELLQGSLDEIFMNLINNKRQMDDNQILKALMVYELCGRAGDEESTAAARALEEAVRSNVTGKIAPILGKSKTVIQNLAEEVKSLQEQVDSMRRAAALVYTQTSLLIVLSLAYGAYILFSLFYSLKFATYVILSYTTCRIALFFMIFVETFAKFLLPIPFFTLTSLAVIILIQLYGFLRSRDGEFPNTPRAIDFCSNKLQAPK